MYILKGRSIDGTVYYMRGGWCSLRHEAERMEEGRAQLHMHIREGLNKNCDPDEIIGQLEVLDSSEEDRRKKIVIAYMASGNSAEDIITQLIECLHPNTQNPFDEAFKEISDDMIEARQHDPESFETTAEEELKILEQMYDEQLEYSANSPILG